MSRRTVLIQLWDGREVPGRLIRGTPAFPFHWAPHGLATRRQLRAQGLCPGGHEPYALLVWKRDRRFAWLYRLDLAKPRRTPSTAQLEALERALAVRRWCRSCRSDVGYCVSRTYGICGDCAVVQGVVAA